ncbi:MAG TPA: hypothetical protein VFA45_20495 [Actinomycetes bacterium]|jgi:hypothetical protein|nr:hypothetical protein [Actinomycetes bacterium]
MTWGFVFVWSPAARRCSPFAHIGGKDEAGDDVGGGIGLASMSSHNVSSYQQDVRTQPGRIAPEVLL